MTGEPTTAAGRAVISEARMMEGWVGHGVVFSVEFLADYISRAEAEARAAALADVTAAVEEVRRLNVRSIAEGPDDYDAARGSLLNEVQAAIKELENR